MLTGISLLVVLGSNKLQASQETRPKEPASAQAQATIPLRVEGNRPLVELTLSRADGTSRKATFLVDSGGGGFVMVESLAKDLGLTWVGWTKEEGQKFSLIEKAPKVSVGEFPLELDPVRVLVVLEKENMLPAAAPGHADGLLPGHVLSKYHVVFDYPAGKFTVAAPGALESKGDALPMPVAKKSGFPRTEIEVDGEKLGFLVDTGASFTMVSEVLLKRWGEKHPDWPRAKGEVGDERDRGARRHLAGRGDVREMDERDDDGADHRVARRQRAQALPRRPRLSEREALPHRSLSEPTPCLKWVRRR
jgi:hypothetical protein